MGGLYRMAGDPQTAREHFSRAVEVEAASGTADSRTALASYLSNVAGVERAAGNLDAALDAYSRALEHLRGVLPRDVPAAIAEEEEAIFSSSDAASRGEGVASREGARLKVLGEGGVLDSVREGRGEGRAGRHDTTRTTPHDTKAKANAKTKAKAIVEYRRHRLSSPPWPPAF